MSALLLRLVGPMQSWGTQSRFTVRDTGFEPSKSGVIGLLCAALGRERAAPIDDLIRVKMGVRVDQEGTLMRDYHTAMDVLIAKAEFDNLETKDTELKDTEVSTRYYLADAAFLVGLESEDLALLKHLQDALANPRWFLFLGRKSFVPSKPVLLHEDAKRGLRENTEMVKALQDYPWLGRPRREDDRPKTLRYVIEHRAGDPASADQPITQVNDQPLSFDIHNRRYAPRRVRTIIKPPNPTIFAHLTAIENQKSEI